MSTLFWVLFWWLLVSIPVAFLVGACIRYGMGGGDDPPE